MEDPQKNKLNFFQKIYLSLAEDQSEVIKNPPPMGVGGINPSSQRYITDNLIRKYPKLGGDKKIYKIIALCFISLFVIALIGLGIVFVFHLK